MPIGVGISSTGTLALVSVQTGQHEPGEHRYYRSLCIQLAHPTDDTWLLVQAALARLYPIYREGSAYSKCAVVLGSIVQTDEFTPDLSAPAGQGRPSERMRVVDRINARYGRRCTWGGCPPIRGGRCGGSCCREGIRPGGGSCRGQVERPSIRSSAD
nr:hypothetical protein [Pseudomonas oryzihabitans]